MTDENKGTAPDDEAAALAEPTIPTLPGFGFLARALADEIADHSLKVGARVGSIRVESLLGEGGMGTVWQGLDESLARPVAVKSLRGLSLSASAKERLRREARLLARLDHPGICRIHELIETEEGDYLVLELVPGQTLGEVARSGLDPDRALVLAEGIADALAAAHAERVIHRDLKPDNVMVTPSGDVKVLDFGISRSLGEKSLAPAPASDLDEELEDPGQEFRLTVTGRLLGTPRYMSPEQARGEVATEASDVFSFGLLLQELLTGRPAFDGGTASEVLGKIVTGTREALPPGTDSEVADLLLQLTAIEPEMRPTAREALDCLRWIRDRPHRRRRRRVRIAVLALLLTALTVALVAGVQAWRTSRQAELQAVAARQLGEEVQAIETLLRLGHLAPAHDVSRERRQAEERLRALEAQEADLGPWARGPLAYARGRIELALGDVERARTLLEEAWSLGYTRPEVAEALGLALGDQYQEAVDEAYQQTSPALSKGALERAALELREPAVKWLRTGASSASPELAEARVALYEERFGDAAAEARVAAETVPWLYEAYEVEARALLSRGRAARNEGDLVQAKGDFDAADAALLAGAGVARSHPGLRMDRCRLGGERLPVLGHEQDLELIRAEVIAACDEAQALLPTSTAPLLAKAALEQGGAWFLAESRRDPTGFIDRLEATAREVLSMDPSLAKAYLLLGRGESLRGTWSGNTGEGNGVHERRALDFYQKAIALDPGSADAQYGLGLGNFNLAFEELMAGGDPKDRLEAAVRALSVASEKAPRAFAPVSMLGSSYGVLAMAALRRGRDPTDYLRNSVLAFEKAIELRRGDPVPRANLALAYRDLAIFKWLRGQDVMEEVEQGRRTLAKVKELAPSYHSVFTNGIELELLAARSAVDGGRDPAVFLETVEQQISELQGLGGAGVETDTAELGAQAHLVAADARLAARQDPEAALLATERVLGGVRAVASRRELVAHVALGRARWANQQGEDPSPFVAEGLRAILLALQEQPESGDLWLLRGRLEALGDPAAAEASLARSLELNPWLQRQVVDVRASFPP